MHGKTVVLSFKDGDFISIGNDMSVLEINGRQMTPAGHAMARERRKKYVFEPAASLGLRPHKLTGQGHIHISRRAFDESSLALKNFFSDFQNRPELIFGGLGNSPPLSALNTKQRRAMAKVNTSFDPVKESIDAFVTLIHERVYTASFFSDRGFPTYYQAVNLTRMGKGPADATLEVRCFRPQKNPEIFELQTILLQTWIRKIKSQRRTIPYLAKDRIYHSPQEIVDGYAQLLADLGLPWEVFKILLPTEIRDVKPNLNQKSVPYSLNDFM